MAPSGAKSSREPEAALREPLRYGVAMTSSRSLLAICATSLVALAGCGSSSSSSDQPTKLTSQEQQQLLDRTTQLSKQIETVATKTVTCVRKQALSGGNEAGIRDCLQGSLNDAASAYADSSSYVNGLASRVSGECKPKLQAFGTAVSQTTDILKQSVADLGKKDLSSFQTTLSKLAPAGTQLQTAAADIGKSCSS